VALVLVSKLALAKVYGNTASLSNSKAKPRGIIFVDFFPWFFSFLSSFFCLLSSLKKKKECFLKRTQKKTVNAVKSRLGNGGGVLNGSLAPAVTHSG